MKRASNAAPATGGRLHAGAPVKALRGTAAGGRKQAWARADAGGRWAARHVRGSSGVGDGGGADSERSASRPPKKQYGKGRALNCGSGTIQWHRRGRFPCCRHELHVSGRA